MPDRRRVVLTPPELAEHIRLHLEEDRGSIAGHLAELRPADIADLLNDLTVAEAAEVLTLLPQSRAVDVCRQPTLRRRGALLGQLEPDFAAGLLNAVEADQRTQIVRQMSPHERHRLLPRLSDEARSEVERLLQYPDESAGGIMTTEFVRLGPAMTAGDAL